MMNLWPSRLYHCGGEAACIKRNETRDVERCQVKRPSSTSNAAEDFDQDYLVKPVHVGFGAPLRKDLRAPDRQCA
jgi:hypothetical protein